MQDPAAGPSTANIAAACAIMGVVTGYLIAQAKSLGLFGGGPILELEEKNKEELDSEDDSEDEDSAPAEFPNNPEECKLVLVVRTDLGMTKGAHCSQMFQHNSSTNKQQAKSQRNAGMRHSHATSSSSATRRTRRYYRDGNAAAR
jgi:hypothetical protein